MGYGELQWRERDASPPAKPSTPNLSAYKIFRNRDGAEIYGIWPSIDWWKLRLTTREPTPDTTNNTLLFTDRSLEMTVFWEAPSTSWCRQMQNHRQILGRDQGNLSGGRIERVEEVKDTYLHIYSQLTWTHGGSQRLSHQPKSTHSLEISSLHICIRCTSCSCGLPNNWCRGYLWLCYLL